MSIQAMTQTTNLSATDDPIEVISDRVHLNVHNKLQLEKQYHKKIQYINKQVYDKKLFVCIFCEKYISAEEVRANQYQSDVLRCTDCKIKDELLDSQYTSTHLRDTYNEI